MGIRKDTSLFGDTKRGNRNLITDVPGVKVGHVTLNAGDVQTGVTALIPGEGSAFRMKFPAAVHVINGFGKSAGLMQVEELGTIETPILLTNTLSVAACLDGLITYMLNDHPEIGTTTGTVNGIVTECNDSFLNDIRGRHVKPEHALEALARADEVFEEGAVGAGRGMKCYGQKGGIGSASRVLEYDGKEYTIGALVLTNFGKRHQLIIGGNAIGETELPTELKAELKKDPIDDASSSAVRDAGKASKKDSFAESTSETREIGSCIMILATDLPLSSRQMKRCCHRAQNGLARTGSQTGGGSGEVVLMFSTANRIPHASEQAVLTASYLHEDKLDPVYSAVADIIEESVISSLTHAETVTGRDGHRLEALI